MSAPITVKNWNVSPNNRCSPGTLIDLAGYYVYTNKTALLASTWAHKWSSDGVTGPSNASDNTDRITSAAAFSVRATVAAAPQSYCLVENPEGVQLLFCYQGASDDVLRISYSASGAFTLAANTTHQPTATDEVIISAGTSIVNSGATLDRVVHVWTASDGTGWRCALYRNGTLQLALSLDKVTPIAPASTFPKPYIAGKFGVMDRVMFAGSTTNPNPTLALNPVSFATGSGSEPNGSANSRGFYGSVFTGGVTRVCRMFGQPYLGSTQTAGPTASIANTIIQQLNAASMGGAGRMCWPINVVGENTANLDGPWGTQIDWFQVVTNSATSPGVTDMMPGYEVGDTPGVSPATPRTNWWVALGAGALWPWKNAAAAMEII